MSDTPLAGKKIMIFAGDIYEDLELWYPKLRCIEAGAEVVTVGAIKGHEYVSKYGYPCVADASVEEVSDAGYAGVICPGGFMPDKVRRDPKVLALVRAFASTGRLVAAICHGGWIPISAQVYRGVRVTGSPGIKDDLVNAGGIWEDAAVVVDRNFICSRKPEDLPYFCREITRFLRTQA